MSQHEGQDLAESVQSLSQLSMGQLSLKETLTRVAEYAVLAIPGAEGAGLTFISEDGSETLVATTAFVTAVDAIQYGMRQGPCITAAKEGQTVLSHSLGDDDRWPSFGAQVSSLGVHSALSLPLATPDRIVGAMNIYARSRNAFDDRAADLGQMFAAPAAIAVQNAQVLSQARALVGQLQAALDKRAAIDQAIGFLIGRDGIRADQALAQLHRTSASQKMKLDEVATELMSDASSHWRPLDQ